MKAYLFPGQGSQHKGMGENMFKNYPDFVAKADKILGYSIEELCVADANGYLNQTQYTQPALYVVNALSYMDIVRNTNIKPDYVAGHSLGEYAALFAAGAISFEAGLQIVKKRGELMAAALGGGMAAVIGLNYSEVLNILSANNLNIDIANLNSATQIVISGKKSDIEISKAIFEQEEKLKMYIPLKVSGAFHSRYMNDSKKIFESFIEEKFLSAPQIQVISNIYAKPYTHNLQEMRNLLIGQICAPVRWNESMRYLIAQGVTEFIEVGPGKVLSKLVEKIKNEYALSPDVDAPSRVGQNDKVFFGADEKQAVNLTGEMRPIKIGELGSEDFLKAHNTCCAYVAGGMYRGVASKELVIKMGQADLLSFFGAGGLDLEVVKENIHKIKQALGDRKPWGVNIVHNMVKPENDDRLVELCLAEGVRRLEAAAFMSITRALVHYRLKGARLINGELNVPNMILAKISRPEVARAFINCPPESLVAQLLREGKLTTAEAQLASRIPMADDIVVEADSGGHTDMATAYSLFPAIRLLSVEMSKKLNYEKRIRVGAAGGIGTPEAALASFMMGADFILTGSINQCTVEAGTSDLVKSMLQDIDVQDTDYAPAGDMFELGAKIQVLKKGVFFPARANKLYDIYRQYNSIDEIDGKTREQLESNYFKKTIEEIFKEIESRYADREPALLKKASNNPKQKMALIFRWYFAKTSRLALAGDISEKVNFQIHCGPALGAFNQWVKGSALEDWKNRSVDEIGIHLMQNTVELLKLQIQKYSKAV